jgi:hypothetical protein
MKYNQPFHFRYNGNGRFGKYIAGVSKERGGMTVLALVDGNTPYHTIKWGVSKCMDTDNYWKREGTALAHKAIREGTFLITKDVSYEIAKEIALDIVGMVKRGGTKNWIGFTTPLIDTLRIS